MSKPDLRALFIEVSQGVQPLAAGPDNSGAEQVAPHLSPAIVDDVFAEVRGDPHLALPVPDVCPYALTTQLADGTMFVTLRQFDRAIRAALR
jgi:hypothetical protein